MPRDEDEINYELVIREKRQDTSALKSILQELFSGVGLVVICIVISKGYCTMHSVHTFLYRYLKESRSLLDLLLNSVTIIRQLHIFAWMTKHLITFLENKYFQ